MLLLVVLDVRCLLSVVGRGSLFVVLRCLLFVVSWCVAFACSCVVRRCLLVDMFW